VSVRATRPSEDSGLAAPKAPVWEVVRAEVAPPDAEGVARLLNTAMDQDPELGAVPAPGRGPRCTPQRADPPPMLDPRRLCVLREVPTHRSVATASMLRRPRTPSSGALREIRTEMAPTRSGGPAHVWPAPLKVTICMTHLPVRGLKRYRLRRW
jgi:hypothetical protein